MTRTPSGDRAEVRINGIPSFSRFRIISFVPSVICPSDVSSVPSMSLNTIFASFIFFHLYLHIFDVYPLYFHIQYDRLTQSTASRECAFSYPRCKILLSFSRTFRASSVYCLISSSVKFPNFA